MLLKQNQTYTQIIYGVKGRRAVRDGFHSRDVVLFIKRRKNEEEKDLG